MPYKDDWFDGASYEYTTPPSSRMTYIVFKVPNAAAGPLEWVEWLYKMDSDGNVAETNMTAHILQCAIDKYFIDHKEGKA